VDGASVGGKIQPTISLYTFSAHSAAWHGIGLSPFPVSRL